MVSADGVVKILDLGMAGLRDMQASDDRLTLAGDVLGTPDYMAPEQWSDVSSIDIRADIYALGCTLYCLVTGAPPFGHGEHPTVPAKMLAHVSEAPADPAASRPEIPQDLRTILQRVLAKKTDERYSSPAEFAAALEPLAAKAHLSKLVGAPPGDDWTAEANPRPAPPLTANANSSRRIRLWGLVAALILTPVLVAMLQRNVGDSDLEVQMVASVERHPAAQATVADPTSDALPSVAATDEQLVRSFQVMHFRYNGELSEQFGPVGTENRPVQLNDEVRVEVELAEPLYAMLVALNTDGTVQLCLPPDEAEAPEMTNRLVFPREPDVYFQLTEGHGLQAFVLLANRTPLPAFVEVRRKLTKSAWSPSTDGAGIWEFNGTSTSPRYAGGQDRGLLVRRSPTVFVDFCNQLVDRTKFSHIHAVAFPVQ